MTNTTFRLAPWADVLYAMDKKWWETYQGEVLNAFPGERVSLAKMLPRYRVTQIDALKHYGNSGAAAISLAAHRGAKRIILLGYDCQHTGGKAHWHGDHPRNLGNARSVTLWAENFAKLAADLAEKGVTVINASRETALECWPREDLGGALEAAG